MSGAAVRAGALLHVAAAALIQLDLQSAASADLLQIEFAPEVFAAPSEAAQGARSVFDSLARVGPSRAR